MNMLVIGLGLFILSILSNIPFSLFGINMLDEGFLIYGVERIMEGSILYKDIFTLYAPGHYYLLSIFLKYFGLNLLTARIYSWIIGGFLAVLVFFISRRIMNNVIFSLLVVLVLIFFVKLQNDRVLFPMLTILLFIEYENRYPKLDRIWQPIIIGLSAGISIVVSQEVGMFLVIALGLLAGWEVLVENKKKIGDKINITRLVQQFLLFSTGLLTILVPVIFYFYKRGALNDLYYCLFWFPVHVFPETMSLPFPNLFLSLLFFLKIPSLSSLYNVIESTLFYLPLVVYILTAIYLILYVYSGRDYQKKYSYIFLILAFGVLSFKTALTRTDIPHLLFCITPAIILGGFLLGELYLRLSDNLRTFKGIKNKKLTVFKCAVSLFLLFLILFGQIENLMVLKNFSNYEKLKLSRAYNIFVPKQEKEDIVNVVNYIEAHTDISEQIFVLPFQAMFYFLSDRDAPTKYDLLLPGYVNGAEAQEEFVMELERVKPKLAIYGHGWDVDGRAFADYAPLIDEYIKQKWHMVKKYVSYDIYSYNDTD